MSETEPSISGSPEMWDLFADRDFTYLAPILQLTFGSNLPKLVSSINYSSNNQSDEREMGMPLSFPVEIKLDRSKMQDVNNEEYIPKEWSDQERQRAYKVGIIVGEVAGVLYDYGMAGGMTDIQRAALNGLNVDREKFKNAVRIYSTNFDYLQDQSPDIHNCFEYDFRDVISPSKVAAPGPMGEWPL